MTRRLPALLLALGALVVAGCSAPPAQTAPLATTRSWPEPKPTKPYTVEELAAAVGCAPQFQGRAADFRQANCEADGEDYVLLDFVTDKGQQDWFEYAVLYGGSYLVGERWILSSSSEDRMVKLQDELGGRIEQDESMGGGGGHGMDMGGS